MFGKQLRRLYELKSLVPDLSDPTAYFYEFENRLQDPLCMEFFCRCEKELQCLDDDAWAFLKDEVKPYLVTRSPDGRRWQQLFDVLGQARAYNHLKASVGCSNVHFIPRASESGRETPDLEGIHDSGRVLCEVKTI